MGDIVATPDVFSSAAAEVTSDQRRHPSSAFQDAMGKVNGQIVGPSFMERTYRNRKHREFPVLKKYKNPRALWCHKSGQAGCEAGAGCLAGLTGLSGDILNGYKMISKMF